MGKFLRLVNGIPMSLTESGSPVIYDQEITRVASLTTGSPLTLPLSQTYDSLELEVYLNNIRLTPTDDYAYEGSVPRTQISFTFDLIIGDAVRFRIDRGA